MDAIQGKSWYCTISTKSLIRSHRPVFDSEQRMYVSRVNLQTDIAVGIPIIRFGHAMSL